MNKQQVLRHALPQRVRLKDYILGPALNHGSFGIVYLARHAITNKKLIIKEYLPNDFALRDRDQMTVVIKSSMFKKDYEWGLRRFLEEGKLVMRYKNHPNIVTVIDLFRSNKSAYMVMEYAGHVDLSQYLERRKVLNNDQLKSLILPLLDALKTIHATGHVHRDIKPGNILISDEGKPILLDFGAARQAVGNLSRDLTAIASDGFAPWEQYQTNGKQGPWTDIYGLAATFYTCIKGIKPATALDRKDEDTVTSVKEEYKSKYSEYLLEMIDWGLMVEVERRPKSVDEWVEPQHRDRFRVNTLFSNQSTTGGVKQEKIKLESNTEPRTINPIGFLFTYWSGFIIMLFNMYNISIGDSANLLKSFLVPFLLILVGILYKTFAFNQTWGIFQSVQKGKKITRSDAVGLSLLPLFSLYWNFIAYPELTTKINEYIHVNKIAVKDSSYSWSIAAAVISVPLQIIIILVLMQPLGFNITEHIDRNLFFIIVLGLLFVMGIIYSVLIDYWSKLTSEIIFQNEVNLRGNR